jgi:hypothetical protein
MQENINMLALAKKLGFTISKGKNSGEYKIRINFDFPEDVESSTVP